jgi:uncharacterized membrane protein
MGDISDESARRIIAGVLLLRLSIEERAKYPGKYQESERALTELITKMTEREAKCLLYTALQSHIHVMSLIISRAMTLGDIGSVAEQLLDTLTSLTGKTLINKCRKAGIDVYWADKEESDGD